GLRAWFERWTISPEFNPEGRAPVTKYLKELADNAASPLMAAVRHAIEDEPHALVRSDLLSLSCLRGVLSGQTLPDFSDQALASVLRELGWEKRERVLLEGIRHTLWSKNFPGDVRSEAGLRLEYL
ncbi:MAG: hypothetical protein EBY17_31240, partial [Acidobacteriia bacterium]|nr:hypothetical protein [Terriglobia bacterium]